MEKCPYCHISVGNNDKYCRSCGATLGLPEFDRAFCPHCGSRVGARQWFCPKCNSPLEIKIEGTRCVSPVQTIPQGIIPLKIQTRPKPWIFLILPGVGLIILALAGAFIWRTLRDRPPLHSLDQAERKAAIITNKPELTSAPVLQPHPAFEQSTTAESEPQVLLRKQLTDVVNNLREAQLRKDISRYMQSYASSFPDLKQKRKKTLAIWNQYDYTILDYNLEHIALLDNDTAVAQVSWNIEARHKENQKRVTFTRVYKVWFGIDSEGWRIKNLKAIP